MSKIQNTEPGSLSLKPWQFSIPRNTFFLPMSHTFASTVFIKRSLCLSNITYLIFSKCFSFSTNLLLCSNLCILPGYFPCLPLVICCILCGGILLSSLNHSFPSKGTGRLDSGLFKSLQCLDMLFPLTFTPWASC